ncbi:MAG: tetratricopeptide repeat protein [Tychonema bourrellyi B0820]|uniref:RNA polymerase subunit sigma-24 n=1 Tax=Tychonema bourrellyi FEM_GT703 TaxID=2040638 RepID=A0A2G4F6C0_9CYAN|nr:tetratricopeptide repeat protein [Tychonema bourrellyi]MDQ2098716.1 tetratricopeptide repeat protein [Tychonema bourrellyi B0820]PHX57298.1 RNA polymerase subunit sigma-24 [Tychonema bourrellyi FEM_GT703]
MSQPTLRASEQGHRQIQQARNANQKKWVAKEDNFTPLIEASQWLINQYAEAKGWNANDPRWVRNFEQFLRVEKHQDINEIKKKIIQSQQGSLFEILTKLIDEGTAFAHGISYRTWSNFAAPKKCLGINAPAFKAYCHVLGLNWQEIAEETQKKSAKVPNVRQNLPGKDGNFIGREQEIERLMTLLSSDSHSRISIEGCGGVGKTSLALEAAYRCLNANQQNAKVPSFEAIIFTSAKAQFLSGQGISERPNRERTLRDIFQAIARTLDTLNTIPADFNEQQKHIRHSLNQQKTLLIVDNLETLDEQQIVLDFLQDLPITVKAVITTRIQTDFPRILLDSLPLDEGLHLIQQQAEAKAITITLSETAASEIYRKTSGIPAAIVYVVGQLAANYKLENVLNQLLSPTSEVANFCFEGSIQPLRGKLAYQLLMTVALFPHPALEEAIIQTAIPNDRDGEAIDEALAKLQQLSLIKYQEDRYQMISLTREYVLNELKINADFEAAARERWLSWYLKYSQKHGGQDGKEWNNYDELSAEWENIQVVIDWCISQEKYSEFLQFWQQVKGYSYAHSYNRDRLTYWSYRLDWTEWLIEAAKSREDWKTAAEAMCDRAWTLTIVGQAKHLELAESLLKKTWQLRHYQSHTFQIDLAINIAVLRICKQQFKKALLWLKKALLLEKMNQHKDEKSKRQHIHISYYQGKVYFLKEDYEQAKIYYQETLKKSQEIGWERGIALAKNWLGDIAVEQENFDEARLLLEESLQIAQRNQDRSQEAYCKESLAFLAKKQQDLTTATYWANLAIEEFNALGMLPEFERMTVFIQGLSVSREPI